MCAAAPPGRPGGDSQIISGPGPDGFFGPNAAGTTDDDLVRVGGAAHVAATVDEPQGAVTTEVGGEVLDRAVSTDPAQTFDAERPGAGSCLLPVLIRGLAAAD